MPRLADGRIAKRGRQRSAHLCPRQLAARRTLRRMPHRNVVALPGRHCQRNTHKFRTHLVGGCCFNVKGDHRSRSQRGGQCFKRSACLHNRNFCQRCRRAARFQHRLPAKQIKLVRSAGCSGCTAARARHALEQRAKVQLTEHGRHARAVKARLRCIEARRSAQLQIKRQRQIRHNCSEPAGEQRAFPSSFQLAAVARWHFIQARIDLIQRKKLLQQLCGTFLTNAGNAGNVVRGIAHQRFIVH